MSHVIYSIAVQTRTSDSNMYKQFLIVLVSKVIVEKAVYDENDLMFVYKYNNNNTYIKVVLLKNYGFKYICFSILTIL